MDVILPKTAYTDGEYKEHDLIQGGINFVNSLIEAAYDVDEIPALGWQIYYLDFYLCQVENGGLSQFVWNSGWKPTVVESVRTGLREVGAEQHLAIFEKLAGDVDALGGQMETYLRQDYFTSDSGIREQLDVHTVAFYDADESIRSLHYAYIKDHPDITVLEFEEYSERLAAYQAANPNREAREQAASAAEREAFDSNPMTAVADALCHAAGLRLNREDTTSIRPFTGVKLPSGDNMEILVDTDKGRYTMVLFDDEAILYKDGTDELGTDRKVFAAEYVYPPEIKRSVLAANGGGTLNRVRGFIVLLISVFVVTGIIAAIVAMLSPLTLLPCLGVAFGLSAVVSGGLTALSMFARPADASDDDDDSDATTDPLVLEWLTAAQVGNIPKLTRMLSAGCDVHAIGPDDESAATVAIRRDQHEALDFLITRGFDVNRPNSNYGTPLLQAARTGNTAMVKMLLGHGADLLARDSDDKGVVHQMVASYEASTINTPLLLALINLGAPVDEKDSAGDTPLLRGLSRGLPLEATRALVEGGADVNAVNDSGESVLYRAACLSSTGKTKDVEASMYATIEFLLSNGADPSVGTCNPIVACKANCVEMLVAAGCDVNGSRKSRYGSSTAMHVVAADLDIAKAESLLRCGADPNILGPFIDQQVTPLDRINHAQARAMEKGEPFDAETADRLRTILKEAGGKNVDDL